MHSNKRKPITTVLRTAIVLRDNLRAFFEQTSQVQQASFMMSHLTLEKKMSILREIEDQEARGKANFTEIGRKFDVFRTTVARIAKGRKELEEDSREGNLQQKRKRKFKEEEIDEALHQWVKQKLSQNARLNLPLLKSKAFELAKVMDRDFTPSDSWINRFKERHGLKFRREHGEKQATDVNAAEYFKRAEMPRILSAYDPEDLYNCDETGLYFKGKCTNRLFSSYQFAYVIMFYCITGLPDRGYAPKNENISGGKKAKERVTVLLCTNMAGTDKRRLLVIGKSKKPRCFPGVLSTLPVTYAHSKNAWMTSKIFNEYLSTWNSSLRSQNRKIGLLLDNCTAHPPGLQYSNINLIFLPQNTTSVLQPLDQGIIRNLKCHYRTLINEKIIHELDADETKLASEALKNINLRDALDMLEEAWAKVKQSTIENCFKKGGFMTCFENGVSEPEIIDVPTPPNLSAETFRELVNQDEDLPVCGMLTDEEIATAVLSKRRRETETDSSSDSEDDGVQEQEPSYKVLNEAMSVIRRFLQCNGREESRKKLKEIENDVFSIMTEKKKQRQITDFFNFV